MPNLKLIISIIKFLKEEGNRSDSADKESLEVAVQCLQTAYDIEDKDCESPENAIPFSLEEIFQSTCLSLEEDGTGSDKIQKAEVMKHLGNSLMKSNQFLQAMKYYTAAIDLDNQNAIYYGNRAAAYSKLNDFHNAIKDCEKAISIDPKYAKAYGRMGLAYASLEQHDEAIKAFTKAYDLEPNNESYQNNLKIALEKKEKPSSNQSGGPGGLAGLSSVDWHTLFTNPAFRNMASTLMQDPNIISALSASMASSLSPGSTNGSPSSGGGGGGVGVGSGGGSSGDGPGVGPVPNSGNSGGGRNNLDMLLEAGQYLAAQMQAANPDLVEQFRQTTSRSFNRQNPDNQDSSTQ